MKIRSLLIACLLLISGSASADNYTPWAQAQKDQCLKANANNPALSADTYCDCLAQNFQKSNITDQDSFKSNQQQAMQVVKSCMQSSAKTK